MPLPQASNLASNTMEDLSLHDDDEILLDDDSDNKTRHDSCLNIELANIKRMS